jgi:hypothetical protein
MVIRRYHPLGWWIALGCVLLVIAMGVPIGITLWYANMNRTAIRDSEAHACQALQLLTAIPAPKPADPAANPSRELNYRFHAALVYWAHASGCS